MKPCWIILITQGLRVWMPPELYLVRDLADVESARWRSTLRIPSRPSRYTPRARLLHLEESLFPEPWRACPVWVGVTWSSRSFPKLQVELRAADDDDATDWLGNHVPNNVTVAKPEQLQFQRGDVTLGVGIIRVKRVLGF